MKHPLLAIPRSLRMPLILLLVGLTLTTMVALNATGKALVTGAAPSGIVSYEFAGDVANASKIIDSWNESSRIYAGFNLGLDYLYLALYSTSIAMALLWSSDRLARRWVILIAIGLAWGQWLAATLDAIENAALFLMLVRAPAEPWPQVAWLCASIKFTLVAAGLLWALVALILHLAARRQE